MPNFFELGLGSVDDGAWLSYRGRLGIEQLVD